MKRDFSALLFIAGISLVGGTIKIKELSTLGQSTPLLWGMAALASAFFGLGAALSLKNTLLRLFPRRNFTYLLLNLFGIASILTIQFLGYASFSMFDSMTSRGTAEILPPLINAAQRSDSEPKAEKMARWAYRLCGVCIAYRHADGSQAPFVPNTEDNNAWESSQKADRTITRVRGIAEGQIRQLPGVMALEANAFLVSFVIPIWWFAFRRLPPDQVPTTAAATPASRSAREVP